MKFYCDFNCIDAEGNVLARSEQFAPRVPKVGSEMLLHDHEGNSARGTVVKVTRKLVYTKMDYKTWKSGY